MTAGSSDDHLERRVASLLMTAKEAFASDERTSSLATTIPSLDEQPLRIAIAGPHNAGKSMLVAALLQLPQDDVDRITDATPATAKVTSYDWRGHTLLDLPGTLSGLEEHDVEARAGVRRADLLLLVTSVELPGEAETDQINKLLADDAFSERTLIVVNKANSEESERQVVGAEMRSRIANYPHIDILFADAKDYVDSRNQPGWTSEDRDELRADSGIDDVVEALSALATRHGKAARLQAVCQEIRRTSVEASALWEPTYDEMAQEIAAARMQEALAAANAEMIDATEVGLGTLESSVTAIGNRLALAVSEEDGSIASHRGVEADGARKKAFATYDDSVNEAVQAVLSRLDEQLEVSFDNLSRYKVGEQSGPSHQERPVTRTKTKTDAKLEELMETAVGAGNRKIKEFVEGGFRPGSPAHDAARKLRRVLRVKNKPHSINRTAKHLTKGGKWMGTAADFTGPLVDFGDAVSTIKLSRAIGRKREEIRSGYAAYAQELVTDQRARLAEYVQEQVALREEAVTAVCLEVRKIADARTHAQTRWAAIAKQAETLAVAIDSALSAEKSDG